jgi:tetratricopeptide (TPR) repeat protein
MRIAMTEGASQRADALLEEAVALDTGFAMAWRRLGVNYGNVGDRAKQRKYIKTALTHQNRLTEKERYLTLGTYYTRVEPDPQKAISAYEALLDLEPKNMPALNNLGLVYARIKDYPRSADYYRKAIEASPGSGTAWFNLVEAHLVLGQKDSATAVLREASARFPDYSGRPWIAAEVAFAKEQRDSARAIYAGIKTAPASSPDDRGTANDRLARIDLVEGRLAQAKARLNENARLASQHGFQQYALDAELGLAAIDGWFLGDRTTATRAVDEALRRYPMEKLDTVTRPYLDVAYLEAMLGRVDRAKAALREFEQLPSEIRDRNEGYRLVVLGVIAMAERRPEDGVRELQTAVVQDPCERCVLTDLGRAWDAAGQPDSAIAAYERYLATPMEDQLDIDSFMLAWTHKRLGELYAQRGDKENASLHLQKFIALWKNADPVLQPQVAEAKRRLAEMVGEKAD